MGHRDGLGQVTNPSSAPASPSAGLVNLCLNPGFETVYPNPSHTILEKIGNSRTFVPGDVDTGLEEVAITDHEFTTEDKVRVNSDTTLPGGLAINTDYFVRAIDADTISFHTTANDATTDTARVNLTSGGTGIHFVALFLPEADGQNTLFPAWQVKMNGALGQITVVETILGFGTGNALDFDITDKFASDTIRLRQIWAGITAGGSIDQELLEYIAKVANLKVIFAVDINMTISKASALRLQIQNSVDGSVQSDYALDNSDDQRLIVEKDLASTINQVTFEILFEKEITGTIDNVMIVVSPISLAALPFAPRNPVNKIGKRIGTGSSEIRLTGTTSKIKTGSGTPSPDEILRNTRPAWATDLELMHQVDIASAGATSRAFTAGDANFYSQQTSDGDADKNTNVTVPLGEDSELELQLSNSALTMDIFKRRWKGLNL